MKVWIIKLESDYEGFVIIDVCSTPEIAAEVARAWVKSKRQVMKITDDHSTRAGH